MKAEIKRWIRRRLRLLVDALDDRLQAAESFPVRAAQRAAAFKLFKNRMPTLVQQHQSYAAAGARAVLMVAQEIGVSRSTAYRWFREFAAGKD